MNLKDKIHVVIRSSHERTMDFCAEIAESVFEVSPVIIKLSPFPKALQASLESGQNSGKEWLICIDADVLIDEAGVMELVKKMFVSKKEVFEVQGRIMDRFFPKPKKGGIHAYRISYIPEAVKELDMLLNESSNRPENNLILKMHKKGFLHESHDIIIGLHDYGQFYKDIYRKCFFHSQKHLNFVPELVSFWRSKVSSHEDFKVALLGLAAGIAGPILNYSQTSTIDAKSSENDLEELTEKSPTISESEKQELRKFIHEECIRGALMMKKSWKQKAKHFIKTMVQV